MNGLGRVGGSAATVVVVVALGFVGALLEIVTALLAPPEDRDPHLGPVVFGLWIVILAGATDLLWPLLDRPRAGSDQLMVLVFILCWLIWKVRSVTTPAEKQRKKEELWASIAGVAAGAVIHHLLV